MWKKLGQQLSGKQMAGVVALVLLAGGAIYGAYIGVQTLWHQRLVARSIPGTLAGVRVQREELMAIIESYKKQLGYYPPMFTGIVSNRGVINPLCYELLGVRFNTNTAQFYLPITKDGLSVKEIETYFNTHWFSNCLYFPNFPTNFLANRALTVSPMTKEIDIFGVAPSYTEFIPEAFWNDYELTSWRYAVNPAEHNPGKFDLWVEVTVDGKHFTIGNWPEVK